MCEKCDAIQKQFVTRALEFYNSSSLTDLLGHEPNRRIVAALLAAVKVGEQLATDEFAGAEEYARHKLEPLLAVALDEFYDLVKLQRNLKEATGKDADIKIVDLGSVKASSFEDALDKIREKLKQSEDRIKSELKNAQKPPSSIPNLVDDEIQRLLKEIEDSGSDLPPLAQ